MIELNFIVFILSVFPNFLQPEWFEIPAVSWELVAKRALPSVWSRRSKITTAGLEAGGQQSPSPTQPCSSTLTPWALPDLRLLR